MSFLSSFSDIQYVERSPGTKTMKDILEESTHLQEAGDKLSRAILDKKQILDIDDDQQAGNNPSNINQKEIDIQMESSPQRTMGEPKNHIHAAEKPLEEVDCSQQRQGDENLNNRHKGSARFHKTDSPHLVDYDHSNTEEKFDKDEVGHISIIESHSLTCSGDNGKGNCDGEAQGVHVLDSFFESSNCLVQREVGHREDIDIGEQSGDATCNANSILGNTPIFHGENHDNPSNLHELSELACKADFERRNMPGEMETHKLLSVNTNSHPGMRLMACTLEDNPREREPDRAGTEYLEQDHTVAVWVKWRGKWQTGIQCSRADCPLPTLRAKPTHERKKYITVFFPRSKTYSWADMLLVCSIDKSPEPLVNGKHRKWRKLVKDLSIPRRYIMQKLAIAMLNISDQLHTEAVIEDARKATTWKKFAMEASSCKDYSDLGMMLLKLQTMVLPQYISHDWLENSFKSWVQRCESVRSAESIELLTEELVDSVLWTDVNELWNAPVQPELGPEWKVWKQEAMKYFFTSHPTPNSENVEHKNSGNSMDVGSHQSRKRPKLEVRRPESSAAPMEVSTSTILPQGPQHNSVNTNMRLSNFLGSPSLEPSFEHSPAAEIFVARDSGDTAKENVHQGLVTMNKYRQCSAFIEAKGRQCGRWANDGDSYCCVHLNSLAVRKPSQEEQVLHLEAPMCGGMTTQGQKCKHRARYGSPFCKKHQFQTRHVSINTENIMSSVGNKIKRKHDEVNGFEKSSGSNINAIDGKELVLVQEIQRSMQEHQVPIMVGETLDERNHLKKKSEVCDTLPTPMEGLCPDSLLCIGNYCQNNRETCTENAKRHHLYCEKHLPRFLKRARDGKSRMVSKDVFMNLLRSCSSRKEKLYLHQACELLYGFMKSSLSCQKPISKGDIMDWILSEASSDLDVGEYLLKLVSCEREKITRLWGFNVDTNKQTSITETSSILALAKCEEDHDPEMAVKCKLCNMGFPDDRKLGAHWTEFHKKEGRWLFRGYACAVCLHSFTNRKVLEMHVKEKHGVQFLEHSMRFRCMSCNGHFVNLEQLWQHVLSSHLAEFRMASGTQGHDHTLIQPVQSKMELGNKLCHYNGDPEDDSQKYICKLCGLKFDLLPDLGRHHQVAHMNQIPISHFLPKRGNHHLKHNGLSHIGFKKSFAAKIRLKKNLQSSNSGFSNIPPLQTRASEVVPLGKLLESHCSDVAKTLFSEIQRTKPRPSNFEILSVARSACCCKNLNAALEEKYGTLPENLYLRAAKLCSELNIQVAWHLDEFICPKGCKPLTDQHSLGPLKALLDGLVEPPAPTVDLINDSNWEMDECHFILQPEHFSSKLRSKVIVLCEDVSFGKEARPVPCVLDEELKNAFHITSDEAPYSLEFGDTMPWRGFAYVTERMIEPSLGLDTKISQLGCACPHPKCCPENCDHVYLFDNDYENAKDIHGKSMRGRFPYDVSGRIILEEGYLVYECNSLCKCDSTCNNRVLQKGLQVNLEIFGTEKKGWAVRAQEAIPCGAFVCEYTGQVLNDDEASKRSERYDNIGRRYLYDTNAHIQGAKGWIEGRVPCMIDASKFGNVSRFINHSCSPNLLSYLVLVESMDCQLAHIGLYASRDISAGEELGYDYCYSLVPGDGCVCHCKAPNCRGRIY